MADQTRRAFIATGAIAAAGFTIVPRHVLGQGMTPPSDTVNIAVVGINGMGASNAQAVMSQNIVAICDVHDALVDARIKDWADSLKPRTPVRAPATGGRPTGPAAPPAGPVVGRGPARGSPPVRSPAAARDRGGDEPPGLDADRSPVGR